MARARSQLKMAPFKFREVEVLYEEPYFAALDRRDLYRERSNRVVLRGRDARSSTSATAHPTNTNDTAVRSANPGGTRDRRAITAGSHNRVSTGGASYGLQGT